MADKIAVTDDSSRITALWKEVFGDTEEDITFFLENCRHKLCLGYFKDDALVSMLFLVDCFYCNRKGAYLYAVCTKSEFRGRGFVSRLIFEAKKLDYEFLWLIPAKDSLFEFYRRFGFETKLFSDGKYTNKVKFDESEEICEYLYEGGDYQYPSGMICSRCKLPVGGTGFKA